MAKVDPSDRILAALTDALSGAGFVLVTHVEVRKGWADIDLVTVHATVAKDDASPALRRTIHEVVGAVLKDKRKLVEIRWPPRRL
jgi:hypothetical protein